MKTHLSKKSLVVLIMAISLPLFVLAATGETEFHSNTADAPRKPDLLIKSVTFNKETGLPIVTIQNAGVVKAGQASKSFKISYLWTNAQGEKLLGVAKWNKVLAAKKTRKVNLSLTNAKQLFSVSQGANITITADPSNLIVEEFENNNLWTGAAPKSDLIVNDIDFNAQSKKITVTMENRGAMRATGKSQMNTGKLAIYWLSEIGEKIGDELSKSFPTIGAGATHKIEFNVGQGNYEGPPEGGKTLVAYADSTNQIVETNEDNNTLQKNVITEPLTYCYPDSPDPACREETDDPDDVIEEETPLVSPENPEYTANPPSESTPPTETPPPAPAPAPDPSTLPRASCMISVEPEPVTANADLIIKSGSVSYTWLNSSIKFIATVLNTGPESTTTVPMRSENVYADANNGDSDLYLCIDTNNDGLWDYVTTTYTNPLAVQHISYSSARWTTPISGTHNYQICADGGNKVIETNETNNCHSGTITLE